MWTFIVGQGSRSRPGFFKKSVLMHSRIFPAWILRMIGHTALIALLLTVLPAAASPSDPEPLILAVHPYLPYNELMERFTPLAEYLAGELGLPVVVKIGTDYREHIVNIGNGIVDIAYLGPAVYVEVVERFGTHPLLAVIETNGTPAFKGIIAVRFDNPISELSELRGKEIAFVDPNSTMGYVVPLYMFLQVMSREDVLRNSKFLNSHVNVALGVLTGDFSAGAVKEEVFYLFRDRGLVELESSPKIPEHLFIARKNLSQETIEAIRNALFELKESESGRLIMNNIKKDMTGMLPIEDSAYNGLREIFKFLEETGNSNDSD
jgi:phosphonate transport system substrate-binding protein